MSRLRQDFGAQATATKKAKLPPVEDWFGCYGSRGDLFAKESYRHPAKMGVGLTYRIFEHGAARGYWKPGDLILDPMGGIGTTAIVGASLGYRVAMIELERHFIELAQGNLYLWEHKHGRRPPVALFHGDARKLSELLGGVNSSGAVSSPPYAGNPRQGNDHHPERQEGGGLWPGNYDAEPAAAAISSPPYGDSALPFAVNWKAMRMARDGQWDEAIAYVRAKERAAVRKGQKFGEATDETIRRRLEEALDRVAGGYSGNGARAPVDKAVSSPPFLAALRGGGIQETGYGDGSDKVGERTYAASTVGKTPGQIGNLRDPAGDIDTVIDGALTSPPWFKEARGGLQGFSDSAKASGVAAERMRAGQRGGNGASAEAIQRQMERAAEHVYGDSPEQVGNTEGETYCLAMLQVYRQLHLVLKPGGVVALVTKNPVRKGKLRRLDLDTIGLMDAAGFTLLERHRAMLREELGAQHTLDGGVVEVVRERKSFFKRLHEKRNPDLRVDHEDVLFFRKVAP